MVCVGLIVSVSVGQAWLGILILSFARTVVRVKRNNRYEVLCAVRHMSSLKSC